MRPLIALGLLAFAGCADSGAPPADPAEPAARVDTGDTGVVAAAAAAGSLQMRVLATGLTNPFEVIAAPDGFLWVTERTIGRVTRVSTKDGSLHPLLTVPDVFITAGAQDGLMGMALDPAFTTGSPYVYLAFTYDRDPDVNVTDERVKIVRYTYSSKKKAMGRPLTLIEGIPGSTDHNSGRLVFGPDGLLYYAVGDQGNDQLSRYCIPNLAQRLPTSVEVAAGDYTGYQGKILRMSKNGAIPAANPTFGGVRSHVFTVGHRNPQGLAFAADGSLVSSEQGPKSDDEINVLVGGRNYGWPNVAGFQDDLAYVYADWPASQNPPCQDLTYDDLSIPPSVPTQDESAWSSPLFQQPARTFYTVPDNYDFTDPACDGSGIYFICWPTIAPSSVATYEGFANGIPGLDDSVLVTSLKLGSLYRVNLHDAGGAVVPNDGSMDLLFSSIDRYRRVTPSRDGRVLYVATDNSGVAMGANGDATFTLEHPGSILVLTGP